MAELKYWLWISELEIDPRSTRRILDYFGSPMEAFFAQEADFQSVGGLTSYDIQRLCKKELDGVYRIQDDMGAAKGRILTQQDAEYPQRLRNIEDAPVVLYVRGNLPVVDDEAAIAIVGTRKCSVYGETAAETMGFGVAQHGGLVVTGLAEGIDAAAARGALKGGGEVIGVLGTGVERVYPPGQKSAQLFEDVLEQGCLISEYPPGASPLPKHFPQRNRIITGLSLAVVAIEIPNEKSGVLHSLRHAENRGRDIFIVPANIDSPTSMLSNRLMVEVYPPTVSGKELLSNYIGQFPRVLESAEIAPPKAIKAKEPPPSRQEEAKKKEVDKKPKEDYIDLEARLANCSEAERAIVKILGNTPMHVDEIIAQCDLPVQKVNVCLTTLTIAGIISSHPGKQYSLNK